VRLARAFGMSDAELVHVRRGALLHDIGRWAFRIVFY
jgi:HD superfamily phosphodiesterase